MVSAQSPRGHDGVEELDPRRKRKRPEEAGDVLLTVSSIKRADALHRCGSGNRQTHQLPGQNLRP